MWLGVATIVLLTGDLPPGCRVVDPPGPPTKVEQPYVEFDLSTLPTDRGGWELRLAVHTTDKDISYFDKVQVGKEKPDIPLMCTVFASGMNELKFRAEVVDNTKIRVYGRPFNDKFLPAVKGVVTSPDLKKEELPKVKNPGKEI